MSNNNTDSSNPVATLDYSKLSREEQIDLLALFNSYDKKLKYNYYSTLFPETGPYRRELYKDAIKFFSAGFDYKERYYSGGNRAGKSVVGTYEDFCHATGLYPDWWTGKKFLTGENINILIMGRTIQNTRDILQRYLLGDANDVGTGMIPKDKILEKTIRAKSGTSGAYDSVQIERIDGARATLFFKAYEQGFEGIAGYTFHVVHMDEPPKKLSLYSEAYARTMSTGGILYLTATPDEGLTEVVSRFLVYGKVPKNNVVPPTREFPDISRWTIAVSLLDVPHVSKEEKRAALSNIPKHMQDAKIFGIPGTGQGKIFNVPEDDITVAPFDIPYHWPRFYGMDFPLSTGTTAVVWFAYDEDNDTLYIYDIYKVKGGEAIVHAAAIRRKGDWIPGTIDPSATKIKDNKQWLEFYRDLGLELTLANNSIEPGIAEIEKRLLDGRLKVFFTCTLWLEEYRMYHWDDNGKIAKNQDDHAIDATRYGVMSGISLARSMKERDDELNNSKDYMDALADLDRNPVTGY